MDGEGEGISEEMKESTDDGLFFGFSAKLLGQLLIDSSADDGAKGDQISCLRRDGASGSRPPPVEGYPNEVGVELISRASNLGYTKDKHLRTT